MKSLIQYFTNEQRARLAGNPRPDPVSTAKDLGDVLAMDWQYDNIMSKKKSHGMKEQSVLEDARLGHPLEVLLGSLSSSTVVRILIRCKKFGIYLLSFQLVSEEPYNLEPENKILNEMLRII